VFVTRVWERREFPCGYAAGRFAQDIEWDARCPIPLDLEPRNRPDRLRAI
jgi:hypothetical protein